MADLWNLSATDLAELRPADFPVTRPLATRWRDNDSYGHVNNAVYYEYFDTAINSWQLEELGETATRNVVAESGCRYLSQLSYPEHLTIGLRVHALGRASVTYQLGVFSGASGAEARPVLAAVGHWVHVYLDPATGRPTPIPDRTRELLVRARPTATTRIEQERS